ncbi:MAG: hypothetical protein J6W64_08030 [Bacilli bacterium]|nr:hypothetical protein [Bacilli bacterium]
MDHNGGYPNEFWVKIKVYNIEYEEPNDNLPKTLELVLNYNHTIHDLENEIIAKVNETVPVKDFRWHFIGKL